VTAKPAPHALVIGASGDIGGCVAELLCSRGIGVSGIDLKESPLSCPGYSHACLDMSRPETIDEVLELTKDKLLSYVINVAGGAEPEELNKPAVTDFAIESLSETFSSNFKTSLAAIVIAKNLAGKSCSRDISVTLCSSVNAVGNYQYPIYSASKSIVESLVLTQAVPLGALGIRINAIRLGTVLTRASLGLHGEAGRGHYEPLLKLTSLARFVTVREAAVALAAAAVDITGMTGEVITVDAGQSIPGNRG
jgi:NAD(P)-dependent dehydrogenase (short-subunit alcohol dehydrogenase family)